MNQGQYSEALTNLQKQETFKSKSQIILIALNASLASFYIGYSIVYFGALPFQTIYNIFRINLQADTARGVLNGCIQVGAFFGALASSLLFQHFSRKTCFFVINALAFITGILILVRSFPTILVGRLLQGLCVGLYSSLVPLYIKEISPVQLSGTLGSYFQLLITVGIFSGAFLPYVLIKISGDHSAVSFWHIVFIFPQTIVLYFIFPYQTPKYLFSVEREAEARQLIQMLYKEQYVEQIIQEKIVDLLLVSNSSSLQPQKVRLPLALSEDQRSKRAKISSGIAVHLTILQQFSGINTVIVYGSVYAKEATNGELAELMTSLINLEQVIATLISGYLLASIGRKTILVYGALFQGLCCMVITIGFQLKLTIGLQSAGEALIIVGLFAFIGVFGVSLGPLVWIYIQDIVQPSFVPFTTGLNWGLTALIVTVFPLLINKVLRGQPQLLFLFFSGWCMVSWVVNRRLLVQTKGKSQKQIQQQLEEVKLC